MVGGRYKFLNIRADISSDDGENYSGEYLCNYLVGICEGERKVERTLNRSLVELDMSDMCADIPDDVYSVKSFKLEGKQVRTVLNPRSDYSMVTWDAVRELKHSVKEFGCCRVRIIDPFGLLSETIGTLKLEYEIANRGLESFRFVVVDVDFGHDVLLGGNFVVGKSDLKPVTLKD